MLARIVLTGVLGGVALLPSPWLYAAPYDQAYDTTGYGVVTLDERVAKLEKQLTGSAMLEMFNNIEKLQAENLRLSGQVEELSHELQTVRKQQRDMYMDLDQRLQAAHNAGTQPDSSTDTTDATYGSNKTGTDATTPSPQQLQPPRPAATPPTTANNDSSGRQAAYQKAFNLLKESKYTDAIKELKTFISTYPTGEFSDNAYYWLGEAQYVNHDLSASRDTFRDMIKKFPQSGKVADALLKIGYIEYDSGQFANSKTLLNDVIKRYPNSSAARMAEKRLEKINTEKH